MFTRRNSCALIDDERSLDIHLEHGATQGSVLGPILFNNYIAHLLLTHFRILVFILTIMIFRFISVLVIQIIHSLVHLFANVYVKYLIGVNKFTQAK